MPEFKTHAECCGKRILVGRWSYEELPHSDLVFSHSVEVIPQFRGLGLGQAQHSDRLDQISASGFTGVVATVKADNLVEKHILEKNGWNKVWSFANKAGEAVELWAKQL